MEVIVAIVLALIIAGGILSIPLALIVIVFTTLCIIGYFQKKNAEPKELNVKTSYYKPKNKPTKESVKV